MKIAVIHGGYSTEKDVSTANAEYVHQGLKELGYNSYLLEYTKDITTILTENKPEAVFLCVQGKGHGDGTLQAILDHLEIPYTGSKREAATVINNKILSQKLFRLAGLPISPFFTWQEKEHYTSQAKEHFLDKMQKAQVHFPCLAKAPSQGGSFGIVYLESIEDFSNILSIFPYDKELLIEEFIPGNFYTVCMIEYQGKLLVLPPMQGKSLENKEKYISFAGDYLLFQGEIDEEAKKIMMQYAEQAHNCLGASGYSRADFILDERTNTPKILEINAVPGLKPKSPFPKIMNICGMSYNDMIEAIVKSIPKN